MQTISCRLLFHCIATWLQSRRPGQTSRNFQKQILIEGRAPPRYAMGQPAHMFQLRLSDTRVAQGRWVHLKSGSRFASHRNLRFHSHTVCAAHNNCVALCTLSPVTVGADRL
jgi:hypothetical protein